MGAMEKYRKVKNWLQDVIAQRGATYTVKEPQYSFEFIMLIGPDKNGDVEQTVKDQASGQHKRYPKQREVKFYLTYRDFMEKIT